MKKVQRGAGRTGARYKEYWGMTRRFQPGQEANYQKLTRMARRPTGRTEIQWQIRTKS
jgi:hypothetical protein